MATGNAQPEACLRRPLGDHNHRGAREQGKRTHDGVGGREGAMSAAEERLQWRTGNGTMLGLGEGQERLRREVEVKMADGEGWEVCYHGCS